MTDQKSRFYSVLVIWIDILMVIFSFFTTYAFRFSSHLIPVQHFPGILVYSKALVAVLPIYLWFFRAYGLYSSHHLRRRIEDIFQVIKAVTFSVIILMALTFLYRDFSYSRIYLLSLWIISILYVSLGRYFLIQYEYWRRRQMKDLTRVLLVGANRNTRNIIQWANNNKHYGREIIGVLTHDADIIGKHFEDIPILGKTDQCEAYIENVRPNEVVLLDTSFTRERISDLVALCEDRFIDFKVGADIYGLMTRNVDVEYLSTVPLLGFRPLPLDDVWNRLIKRLFDITIATLMLILSSPLWLFCMLLIKLSDQGPVFYLQERMGRDGKLFNVIKFRTMKVDAEKETGPVWAKANDTRKTGLGAFLRKYNIDELPQLFNVLAGNMSLVGPRPERPHFIEKFRDEIPRYMARHKIKSGLTGWAQVNGYRGNTSIEERIKFDLYYMENWSLVLDIEILFMTLFAFKNAY